MPSRLSLTSAPLSLLLFFLLLAHSPLNLTHCIVSKLREKFYAHSLPRPSFPANYLYSTTILCDPKIIERYGLQELEARQAALLGFLLTPVISTGTVKGAPNDQMDKRRLLEERGKWKLRPNKFHEADETIGDTSTTNNCHQNDNNNNVNKVASQLNITTLTRPHLMILLCLFINNYLTISCAVRECNFEKYANTGGCFSQANFVCDRDTNICKCHPDLPVLVDDRLCVKKAKTNEICQYQEQCDNANGFYCCYSDFKFVNDTNLPLDSSREPARCKNLKSRKHKQSSSPPSTAPQNSIPESSNLPRLLWTLLIACVFGVVALLILISTQYYRSNRSLVNCELDVPPPYEIAVGLRHS